MIKSINHFFIWIKLPKFAHNRHFCSWHNYCIYSGMKDKRKQANKINRVKIRQRAIQKTEANLRRQTFFDPTYDPVFKKIFEKMETLVHFLNAILHLEGKRRVVYANPLRPTINLSRSDKKQKITRFDVHARTVDGHFIDIEMQRVGHEDFLDRIELYSSLLSINAKILMDSEKSQKRRTEHPYRMPPVYSIWICNFDVPFCESYHEEIALYRSSDVGKSKALPIYAKKRYIIIDLTKFVPKKNGSPESEWIKLFKTMPRAKRTPKGIDDVMDDVYERLRIGNATSKFIKKVATYMVTKEEIWTRLGTARREGFADGEAKANKRIAVRDKKIAEFLQSIGVSKKNIATAFSIK